MGALMLPWDAEKLAQALPGWPVQVFEVLDSTQNECLSRARELPDRAVVLAAQQRHGRGRQGRVWQSPPGANLYLSMLAHAPAGGRWPSCVTLALGIAAADALRELGLAQVGLKWPNDLWVDGRKLGGILVEVAPSNAIVAGIGLNVCLPGAVRQAIGQPCIDLHELGCRPEPEMLAAGLVEHWSRMLDLLVARGWSAVAPRWSRYDLLAGQALCVDAGNEGLIEGIGGGIDEQGGLRVQCGDHWRVFSSVQVSVRPT